MDEKTLSQLKQKTFISPFPQPYTLPPPPPPTMNNNNVQSNIFNLNNMVSPSVLLIIIILAIIFFISGLLHLLVRFLLRPPSRDNNNNHDNELDSVTALQGQLQQLFNLHDSGVDQTFIDTLPVFTYKAIIGVKDPFDCAVCLCEFEGEDKLRLLPKCSHAFHMECIDTWLLSHSTCPLCRACLLQDFSQTSNNCSSSPIVFVLESGSREISREIIIGSERESNNNNNEDLRVPLQDLLKKSCEFQVKEVEDQGINIEKIVQVKLGKFKNVDITGEGSSNNNDSSIDSRRCFSMGAFAYVMDDNTSLKVPIIAPVNKKSSSKKNNSLHRGALSECGWDSRREFNGLDASKILEHKGVEESKRKSFSTSKNWLGEGKERNNNNTARIVSSSSRRTFSEVGFAFDRYENDEVQSCSNSFASQPNAPSFTRRTLQWLMGKPNKVEQSHFSSNV